MRNKFNSTSLNDEKKKYPLFRNDNRIVRILKKIRPYRKILFQMYRKKVPIDNLIRMQFPYLLPDAQKPPIVQLEFTNACNMECVYCTSPLGLRPRGFMSEESFSNVVRSLRDYEINRGRVVGNGEPTIHPKFPQFVRELAKSVKHLTVVTNGQWKNEEIFISLLTAPVDQIEISVDAGNKEDYESSRIGGSFDQLTNNIKQLLEAKKDFHSSSIINIRLMIRPSKKKLIKQLVKYWRKYADAIQPDYIYKKSKYLQYDEDIFIPHQNKTQLTPKCSLPFKGISVNWDGNVPLCDYSFSQVGPSDFFLGNINDRNLIEIWNCEVLKLYRNGHRYRKLEQITICKGCSGI